MWCVDSRWGAQRGWWEASVPMVHGSWWDFMVKCCYVNRLKWSRLRLKFLSAVVFMLFTEMASVNYSLSSISTFHTWGTESRSSALAEQSRAVQNFLNFMRFGGNFEIFVCWRPLLGKSRIHPWSVYELFDPNETLKNAKNKHWIRFKTRNGMISRTGSVTFLEWNNLTTSFELYQ